MSAYFDAYGRGASDPIDAPFHRLRLGLPMGLLIEHVIAHHPDTFFFIVPHGTRVALTEPSMAVTVANYIVLRGSTP